MARVWHVCTCDKYMMCVTYVFSCLWYIFCAFVWLKHYMWHGMNIVCGCIYDFCMRHVGHVWVSQERNKRGHGNQGRAEMFEGAFADILLSSNCHSSA